MLERLEIRLGAIAAQVRQRVTRDVAARLADALPEISVSQEGEGDRVALAAPGLRRRFFIDARLRWIGALLR